MDFIECEKPQGAGYCSDNECTCTPTPMSEGQGYIYISEEVVQFRKDALSLAAVQEKIAKLSSDSGEYISISKYAPILICEEAAKKRKLDLAAASEDCFLYWGSGIVPLRPTPLEKTEQTPQSLPFVNQFSTPVVPINQHDPSKFIPEIGPIPEKSYIAPIEPLSVSPTQPEVDYSSTTTIAAKPLNQAVDLLFNDKQGTPDKNRDVSVDDVVAQYASGPLAEMAKKMAQDLKSESSDSYYNQNISGSDKGNWETSTTLNKIKTPLPNYSYEDSEESQRAGDYLRENSFPEQEENYSGKKNTPDKPVKKKAQSGTANNHTVLLIVIPILLIVISAVIVVAVVVPNLNKKVEPPPVFPDTSEMTSSAQAIELDDSFFRNQYSFQDNVSEGTIGFSTLQANNGRYSLNIRQKGKTRVRTVTGTFSYTTQGITFHPDGHSTNIVWVLEELEPNNTSAVFLDPLQENRESTKVYLKRKE